MVSVVFFISFAEELHSRWNELSAKSVACACRPISPPPTPWGSRPTLTGLTSIHSTSSGEEGTWLQPAWGPSAELQTELFCPTVPNAERVGLVSLGTKPPGTQGLNRPNRLGELRFHIVLLHLDFRDITETKAHLRAASFLWVNIAAGSKVDLLILFSLCNFNHIPAGQS